MLSGAYFFWLYDRLIRPSLKKKELIETGMTPALKEAIKEVSKKQEKKTIHKLISMLDNGLNSTFSLTYTQENDIPLITENELFKEAMNWYAYRQSRYFTFYFEKGYVVMDREHIIEMKVQEETV